MRPKKLANPDPNYQERLEQESNFHFHTENGKQYWVDDRYFEFDREFGDKMYDATKEVWDMCLKAVQHVMDNKLYSKFHIPAYMIPHIENSWNNETPSVYGRFDFGLDQITGNLKMLEFNADTPTSLFECGVVQWQWKEHYFKSLSTYDQFTSIHDALIEHFKYLKEYFNGETLHFTSVRDSIEDLTNVEYLRDCALQAGVNTKFLYIDELGWDETNKVFVDLEDEVITDIFKLYPWEWMVNEKFGKNVVRDQSNTNWIEPSWKMILSNKAILPILWELFPNNEYLLESYFEGPKEMKDYVVKPLLSREGANVTIYRNGEKTEESVGEYGEEGMIYQQFVDLPHFDEGYIILGSWMVGEESVGMTVRESDGRITDNISRFVPHVLVI